MSNKEDEFKKKLDEQTKRNSKEFRLMGCSQAFKGKFVVMRDGEIKEFALFDNRKDAQEMGEEWFPDKIFTIHQFDDTHVDRNRRAAN